MQEDEEKLKAMGQRYTRLTIVSLFLLALLHGLDSLFFTIFFWLSLGFGSLAINFAIASKRASEPNVSWGDSESRSQSFQKKKNLIVIIVSLGVGFILFFAIIASILSSSGDVEEQSAQSANQNTRGGSQENQLSDYQLASKEYDNQNYRESISMCRRALISQPENIDLILLLGDNYGSLKQYDSAYIWFDKAYQSGARSAYLSHWMGYFYDEKGETARAIEFYKDALHQDSTRTPIYDRLAELIPDQADWYRQKSKQWSAK